MNRPSPRSHNHPVQLGHRGSEPDRTGVPAGVRVAGNVRGGHREEEDGFVPGEIRHHVIWTIIIIAISDFTFIDHRQHVHACQWGTCPFSSGRRDGRRCKWVTSRRKCHPAIRWCSVIDKKVVKCTNFAEVIYSFPLVENFLIGMMFIPYFTVVTAYFLKIDMMLNNR